jgi:hypothetical protein
MSSHAHAVTLTSSRTASPHDHRHGADHDDRQEEAGPQRPPGITLGGDDGERGERSRRPPWPQRWHDVGDPRGR